MSHAPHLHQRLTLYFVLAPSVAAMVPQTAFRCGHPFCEQHQREYDLIPFDTCPSCGGFPEVFETGRTVAAFPNLADFLTSLQDDIDDADTFALQDLTGLPDNVWVYNRDVSWIQDRCPGFSPNSAGVLDLRTFPADDLLRIAFLGDPDIETFLDACSERFGENSLSLNLGFIQYWDF